MTKSNIIHINDKKYDGSELKKQLDRITVSQNVYTNNLIQLLKDKEVTDDQSE